MDRISKYVVIGLLTAVVIRSLLVYFGHGLSRLEVVLMVSAVLVIVEEIRLNRWLGEKTNT
jgi:predicted tellurium resistance membrane protein TerC